MRVAVCGVLGLAASLACSRGSLQQPDGGAVLDTGTLPDGPAPAGRQSFVVTATLQEHGGDGSVPVPTGHRFTLVLDWNARLAIIGDNGTGGAVPLQPTSAGGTVSQTPPLDLGNYTGVWYQRLDLAIDATGSLTGTAQGQASFAPPTTDIARTTVVTASLTGKPDDELPMLTLKGVSAVATDPFSSLVAFASEPLPPSTRLLVTNSRGDRVDLLPSAAATDAAFSFAPATPRMWRYLEQYTVSSTRVADFAGNTTGDATESFTVAAPPPLVAEDGFESAMGTTLGGAQLLSGAGAPAISGARSLYIPAASVPLGQGAQQQLAIRLALTPGDSVIRFSYRTVKPSTAASAIFAYGFFRVASEGGEIAYLAPTLTEAPTTTVSIGSSEFLLGPITTAEIPLPQDAAGEITLTRSAPGGSGLPAPPVVGLIIDDLRAE